MFSVLSGGEILLLDWELNGEQPVRDVKTKTVRKYPHPTDHFPALFYEKKEWKESKKHTSIYIYTTVHVSLFPPQVT